MNFFQSIENTLGVIAYTDGACSGNPGPGGWGVFISCGDNVHDLYGGEILTTNNRMELMACIEALKFIPKNKSVVIRTDSKYVKDGINTWIKGWKKNGWKTASGSAVKNIDLWQELDKLAHEHNLTWEWVAGHSGEPGNERADMLAKQGIVKARLSGV